MRHMLERPIRHTIVDQYDPEHHVAGGSSGFIRDLIRHAGPKRQFTIIGVTQDRRRRLGHPIRIDVDGRPVDFLPVARVRDAMYKRRIPQTAQLVAGVIAFHPTFEADVVHFHRAETTVALSRYAKDTRVISFIHGAGQAHQFGARSESFWRAVPPGVYQRIILMAIRRSDFAYVMDRRKAEALGQSFRNVEAGRNWYDGELFSLEGGSPRRTA